eukprot:CAMPEP_0197523886 /NCGR_PEP_ID=MMETSP1318-20131121/8719_1 /TAXON_ID=552666 /ORGANISM="Partenskyella glossopodia, Strain RCC365" /LENGTH=373 /DNA_ID=CAMNT_0043076711 /DNA_START=76 /DNA_END=1197 /DNA_ORIENTATION=-
MRLSKALLLLPLAASAATRSLNETEENVPIETEEKLIEYVERKWISDEPGTPMKVHYGGDTWNVKVLSGSGKSGVICSIDGDDKHIIKLPRNNKAAELFADERDGANFLHKHGINALQALYFKSAVEPPPTISQATPPGVKSSYAVSVTYNEHTNAIPGMLVKKKVHGADLWEIIQLLCLGDKKYKPNECFGREGKKLVYRSARYNEIKRMVDRGFFSNHRETIMLQVIPKVKCMWAKIADLMKVQKPEAFLDDLKPENFMYDFRKNKLFLVDFFFWEKGTSRYDEMKSMPNPPGPAYMVAQMWNMQGGGCVGKHWSGMKLPANFGTISHNFSPFCEIPHHHSSAMHSNSTKNVERSNKKRDSQLLMDGALDV